MPKLSKSRSPAQIKQTASLHVPRAARRRAAIITEDEQAEMLQLKAKVKDLQRQLRNQRKRTKRAKAACLRGVRCAGDEEKRAPSPEHGGEVEVDEEVNRSGEATERAEEAC